MEQTAVAVALGFGAVGLVVGAVLVYRHLAMALFTVRILRSEPTPIGDLPDGGPVEVHGTTGVVAGADVTAPFSERRCLAYEATGKVRHGGSLSHWEVLMEDRAVTPFVLRDDTGSVRVEGDPELALAETEIDETDVPESIRAEIDDRAGASTPDGNETPDGHDPTDSPRRIAPDPETTTKYVERRLEADESVHVYGVAGAPATDEWGRSRSDGLVTGSEQVPLVISDGSRYHTAWRLGRRSVIWTVLGLGFLGYGVGVFVYGLTLLAV